MPQESYWKAEQTGTIILIFIKTKKLESRKYTVMNLTWIQDEWLKEIVRWVALNTEKESNVHEEPAWSQLTSFSLLRGLSLIMFVSLVFIVLLQEVCAMESMQIMDRVILHKMMYSLILFYFWLYCYLQNLGFLTRDWTWAPGSERTKS